MRRSRAALIFPLAALVLAGCAQPARTPAELAALRARSPNPPAQPFVPTPPPTGVSSVPGDRAVAPTPAPPRPPALAGLPVPGSPAPGPDAAPGAPDAAAAPTPAPPAPAPTPAAAATPRPGLGPEERRVPVDSATAPWRSIGMVTAEGGGRCTGAVIGPRTVLTAAHCVVNPRTGQPLEPQNVQYVIGPTGQGAGRRVLVAAVLIGDGFRVLPGPRPAPDTRPDSDWAVLELDPSVPAAPPEFVLELFAGLMPPWTEAALGGYQPDRGPGLVADLACYVVNVARDRTGAMMLRHSCAGTGGSSGGPLLVRLTDGAWRVAGVASLAFNNEVGGWAVPSLTVTRALEAAAAGR